MAVQSCAYDRCTCKFQEGNGLEREGRLFCDDYCVGSLNPENFDSAAFDSGAFDTTSGSRCHCGHPGCG
jgi:hypothetical protein